MQTRNLGCLCWTACWLRAGGGTRPGARASSAISQRSISLSFIKWTLKARLMSALDPIQDGGKELRSGSGCWREEPPLSEAQLRQPRVLEGARRLPHLSLPCGGAKGGPRPQISAWGLEPRASHRGQFFPPLLLSAIAPGQPCPWSPHGHCHF